MSKYDFDLDLESRNSLSVIISRLQPNSKVLEFGPANGRLTRYLKEALGCEVTIVEIDQEAGQVASQFATKAMIGEVDGNIESFIWENYIEESYFDFIIFADVLEHLYNPKEVLKRVRRYLSPTGKVLISIPNISHNSILINLINDQFRYTSTGLLDDTHIRFFTHHSLRQLVSELFFNISLETATYLNVGGNEVSSTYEQVSTEIRKELFKRPYGHVYQHIFELELPAVNTEVGRTKVYKINPIKPFQCMILVKEEEDHSFSEEKKIITEVAQGYCRVVFDLSVFENVLELRFDPVNVSSVLRFHKIVGVKDEQEIAISIHSSNANYISENTYWFLHDDPNIFFDNVQFDKLIVDFEIIDVYIENQEFLISELIRKSERCIASEIAVIELGATLQKQEIALQEKVTSLQSQETNLEEKNREIISLKENIRKQVELVQVLEGKIAHTFKQKVKSLFKE